MSLRGGAILEVAERVALDRLPERFRGPMRAYLEQGELSDPELRMLLEKDVGSAWQAQAIGDLLELGQTMAWIDDELPDECWGNRDQVQLWIVFVRRARGRALLASFELGV